jgi:hypothetical protein
VKRIRIALATAGILLLMFGLFRLVTQISVYNLLILAVWLGLAVAIHDGVLSPVIVGIGAAFTRIPARARRYLQAALIVAALVTVIALPLIHRENTQPKSKAIEQQNYGGNLTIILSIIAAATLAAYGVKVFRDSQRKPARQRVQPVQAPSATNDRPPDDHSSSTP